MAMYTCVSPVSNLHSDVAQTHYAHRLAPQLAVEWVEGPDEADVVVTVVVVVSVVVVVTVVTVVVVVSVVALKAKLATVAMPRATAVLYHGCRGICVWTEGSSIQIRNSYHHTISIRAPLGHAQNRSHEFRSPGPKGRHEQVWRLL